MDVRTTERQPGIQSHTVRTTRLPGLSRVALLCVAIAISISTLSAPSAALAQQRIVRVGLYENEPKVYTNADTDRPAGLFVDLIEAVAQEEDWDIVWVPGTWEDGLEGLEAGTLDLMPDVAYSSERDVQFDFHRTPVIESWSCVYTNPSIQVDRISQLTGMRVAVLSGSIQETVLSQTIDGFQYDIELVPVMSLKEAFELTQDRTVDAAAANYLFGDYFYGDYGLVKTPIVFNAVPLFYATKQAANPDLLAAIDLHLDTWLQEPGSPYYQILSTYTATPATPRLPTWVPWVLVVGITVIVGMAVTVMLLRWQVAVQTKDLRTAHAATLKTEEDLRLAVDAAEEGVFDWKPKTGEVLWTPRNYTMLGYEPDEFPSSFEAWRTRIHPDDRERVIAQEWDGMRGPDRTFNVEYRVRTKDGGWIWAGSRGRAVSVDDRGEPTRVVGVNVDITDRKRAQIELERHKYHLEELVTARTAELAQANLELEAATETKSRFLANVSHELRTPLNSIIGFAGLLSSGMVGPLSEEQNLQIAMIGRSGTQLLDLINDILDISKIEAGMVDVHFDWVDPGELVHMVADSLRPLADDKQLPLRIEVAEHLTPLQSDRDKIRQILVNILGNAIKYTSTGSITISVHETDNATIRFAVSDTGPGIAAQEIDQIFEAFHRSDPNSGTHLPGTGLGLSISREFAHLLGGELLVDSTLGIGSTFTLVLPVLAAADPQPNPPLTRDSFGDSVE